MMDYLICYLLAGFAISALGIIGYALKHGKLLLSTVVAAAFLTLFWPILIALIAVAWVGDNWETTIWSRKKDG